MKKLAYLFAVLLFAAHNCMATGHGVVIGGVKWATRNVGAPGKFVDDPWDGGSFYSFLEARTACPAGWRIPTFGEIDRLVRLGSKWVTLNGMNGRLFGTGNTGEKGAGETTLFLPAAGYQDNFNADRPVYGPGFSGGYWVGGTYMFFTALRIDSSGGFTVYEDGFSVRCVAD